MSPETLGGSAPSAGAGVGSRGRPSSPALTPPEILLAALQRRVAETVVGYQSVVRLLSVALVSEGHVLLEGVPGIAKTLLVRCFADSLALSFKRIQFTPDMLPSDIVGSLVLNPTSRAFEYRKGPVFANVVLADEINRAPPKVQSALLESMQERQVTVDGVGYPLPRPFIVIATQNPIEQEGTYPLPEAELDRLLFRILMGYPSEADERTLVRLHSDVPPVRQVGPLVDAAVLESFQQQVAPVYCSEDVLDYIVQLLRATRDDRRIMVGASPRAGVQLARAAKAEAMWAGRNYVTPEDVRSIAFWVLNHRVALHPELLAQQYVEGGIGTEPVVREVMSDLFDRLPAPR
ncbi:MAG: MoxR family ATPase [Thermoplasmata archaeon]|nr:MoxR family ATPase [Thermoplasmata archaeon]